MNHVFVLYDRATDSVWYPLKDGAFDAVAGQHKGRKLEFIAKPEVTTFERWVKLHPDTKILLPPQAATEEEREAAAKRVRGRKKDPPPGN